MSENGFKVSYENGTMRFSKLPDLIKTLGITPNEFFEWETETIAGVYAANITGGNMQNSDTAILALRDELREQRSMLKEKDRQIARLLDLLERTDRTGYSSLAADAPVGYNVGEKKDGGK